MSAILDPQQELFAKVKLDIESLGFAVYDGFLPPENTPYPFVYLGDCRQQDEAYKGVICGSVYLTIHVWHNSPKQRGTVSAMLLAIKTALRSIERTNNFAWAVRDVAQQIIPDNTTRTPLLHGVIEAEVKFS